MSSDSILDEAKTISPLTATCIVVANMIGTGIFTSLGFLCTENGGAQTSLPDTAAWTQYALKNGLRGMFSWRLDNDHGQQGTEEDVDPTFTGAKTIYDTVQAYGNSAGSAS